MKLPRLPFMPASAINPDAFMAAQILRDLELLSTVVQEFNPLAGDRVRNIAMQVRTSGPNSLTPTEVLWLSFFMAEARDYRLRRQLSQAGLSG